MTKEEFDKIRTVSRMCFIDPGLGGTAIAHFFGGHIPNTYAFKASRAGKDFMPRVKEIVDPVAVCMRDIRSEHPIDVVYIEGVELRGDNSKSQKSARRGDLFKLAYLVGALGAELTRVGFFVKFISPQWKGNLNDDQIKERLLMFNRIEYPNEHVRAAVAMGFAKAGVL